MAVYLSRSPGSSGGAPSNTAGGTSPFMFYAKTYGAGSTDQETIFVPDAGKVRVQITTASDVGTVQGTACPPDVVDAGTATWVAVSAGLTNVTATTVSELVEGFVAIRVSKASACVANFNVRC
jgi:hypothetical protein